MIGALLEQLDERWRASLEVSVYRPVRGVTDLVFEGPEPPLIACEAQSELRRLEQQVRWSGAKVEALAAARGMPVERLLLLRSTRRTRALAIEYETLLQTAYPAATGAAYTALTRGSRWPGDALLWCGIEPGRAWISDRPPRGVRLGRVAHPEVTEWTSSRRQ